MKTLKTMILSLVLGLSAVTAQAQTANLQVIHNAPDPAAEVVDIYVNGSLFLPDFAFRTATPFVEVPAGVELSIAVAPGNSSSVDDALASFPVTLMNNKTYVAIANGVLTPDDFAVNPEGLDIAFTLFAKDGIRTESRWRSLVDLIAFHGSPDAPTVDVRIKDWPWGAFFNDLSYGEFSRYRSAITKDYILEVTPGNDKNTVVATFRADLSGLAGGAAVVFASGFLTPAANQNGPAFGLFAALPTGDVVQLPAVQEVAELQVIHNAADPAAEVVDIYVNDDLFIPDFAFRTATPFVEVPAGVNLTIGVAPGNSSSADDVIAEFDVVLEAYQRYVVMANGVLDPSMFAANPDGQSIGFTLFPQNDIRDKARFGIGVNLIAFHGASDAPGVDIIAKANRKWGTRIFDDLTYGEFSSYKFFWPRDYVLEVTPENDNSTVVAAFEADLSGLYGKAAVVVASGFLNPAANQNGPAFGLFVAFTDGTVIALPAAKNTGGGFAASKADGENNLPGAYQLEQNYPNPFNPTTTISFALPEASRVTLQVFNILGQEVSTLVDGELAAGTHEIDFDAGSLATGVYFYRLSTDSFNDTRKMMLVK